MRGCSACSAAATSSARPVSTVPPTAISVSAASQIRGSGGYEPAPRADSTRPVADTSQASVARRRIATGFSTVTCTCSVWGKSRS